MTPPPPNGKQEKINDNILITTTKVSKQKTLTVILNSETVVLVRQE
jgi:hypothetical protein